MATKYSYTKDVSGFSLDQLTYEIEQNSTITTAIDHIDFSQPDLDVWFESDLSGAEETELGIVVAASPNANTPMPTEDIAASILVGSIEGMKLEPDDTNPTYQVNILKGSCRDSTGIHTIKIEVTKTVDITVSGAGGLDTGSEAADTWYAVYVIDDTGGTNSPAGLFSADDETPTLPNGYNVFRRIGWVRNNSSSDFWEFSQKGKSSSRVYYHLENNTNLQALSDGNATTWTDVDLSSFAPSTCNDVILQVGFKTGSSGEQGDIVSLRMKGSSKQKINIGPGVVNTRPMFVPLEMNTDQNQTIQYKADSENNNVDLYVLAWHDDL